MSRNARGTVRIPTQAREADDCVQVGEAAVGGYQVDELVVYPWLPPSAAYRTEDPQYGHVLVRAWAGLLSFPTVR
jgi:hypothetical protein